MKKTDSKLYWPTALVLVVLLLVNAAIILLLEGEDRVTALLSADALGLVVLGFMRQIWGVAAVLVLVVTGAIAGCGASLEVRTDYALEQARCIRNQQEIVDRPGTTYDQDYEDMVAEVARCNRELRLIEERED
jgi:hypothetical protein